MQIVKNLTIEELNSEKETLKSKNKLFGKDKMRLKKIENEILKRENKIDTEGTFSNDDMQKELKLQYVELDKIIMPEYNDSSGIDKEKIKELAESIKNDGLIQNPIVEPIENDMYRKVVGRRRILATRLNGNKKILCKILSDKIDTFEKEMIIWNENNQREELNLYDKVRFYLRFVKNRFDLDSEEDAQKLVEHLNNLKKKKIKIPEDKKKQIVELEILLNKLKGYKSISSLSNNLSVLKFDKILLDYLNDNKLTFKLAQYINRKKDFIVSIYSIDRFYEVCNEIVKNEYSVNEAKKYIDKLINTSKQKNNKQLSFEKSYKEFKYILDNLPEEKYEKATEVINDLINRLK